VGKTLRTIDGRRLAERPLNNAVVVAARLYRTDLDRFEALFAADGDDVVRAIADLKRRAAAGDPWAAPPARRAGP
jgi:predicted aminopeptidase